MIWLLMPSPLPVSRVLRNHMVQCGQMANGRKASHWCLGREANLWPGTSRPYVLWLMHMWQQLQGRPAQQRNVRLSSKSPNILVWRISISSSQLQRSRLVHSMFIDSLSVFEGSREKDLRPVRWRERECLSVPKVICCHSAIQRCLLHNSFEAADHLG